MAISIFPTPAAGGAEADAFAATIPTLQTTFEHVQAFSAGVYSIAIAPTSTNAHIVFADNTSVLTTLTTSSGIVSTQLSTPATKVYITALAGGTTNAIVTITKTADILTPDDIGNGTLDTINSTQTYNQTGLLSVLAFGGGFAGQRGGIGNDMGEGGSRGGSGGASGLLVYGFVHSNGPTTVTVGAKGTAATDNNSTRVAPGSSSFGNLLTETNNFFYIGGAGVPGPEFTNNGTGGTASRTFPSFNSTSTTGGGGSGSPHATGAAKSGGGSGIGTGGSGAAGHIADQNNANPTVPANAATGKAAGGGGGSGTGTNNPNAVGRYGKDGSDGVVYILRGF